MESIIRVWGDADSVTERPFVKSVCSHATKLLDVQYYNVTLPFVKSVCSHGTKLKKCCRNSLEKATTANATLLSMDQVDGGCAFNQIINVVEIYFSKEEKLVQIAIFNQ